MLTFLTMNKVLKMKILIQGEMSLDGFILRHAIAALDTARSILNFGLRCQQMSYPEIPVKLHEALIQ